MNLRVLQLYFVDGIPSLGGRQSIGAIAAPGVPVAESIRRTPGGFLIGLNRETASGKVVVMHFVPDARVLSATVEELEDEEPRKSKAKAQA